jgi:hypothetical protein
MALYDSLYPHFGIAKLREQHGQQWAEIVDHIRTLSVTDPYVMAFTLTVKRIRKQNKLATSQCKDPLCAVCIAEVLEYFSGSEEELVTFYFNNLHEIQQTVKLMHRQAKPQGALRVGAAA